jgi:hypothetical protein
MTTSHEALMVLILFYPCCRSSSTTWSLERIAESLGKLHRKRNTCVDSKARQLSVPERAAGYVFFLSGHFAAS